MAFRKKEKNLLITKTTIKIVFYFRTSSSSKSSSLQDQNLSRLLVDGCSNIAVLHDRNENYYQQHYLAAILPGGGNR